ncbi:acetylglutamate kinase [Geofilum rubicundum]|uniref:Acetylglutamate kinase n=1 Tax=Geofilum rubicundum JCM 15548 TaxID=1236989 RepID=A0A0E9LUV0_9BACT|nr:acetylglutamate kinase [Geofilum rubicundum]GAO29083.1 acetylglutamate kinase [Geofilum rubicundum JCM 15548]
MQELTIVKVGGKVVEEAENLASLLRDFSAIKGPKILVHGGGRSATAMAQRLGVETKMVEGRRITDAAMLEVVTMVYGGLVNKNIVAGLQAHQTNALGMTGADMNIIRSKRRAKGAVDYGFVGDIEAVDASGLTRLLTAGAVPVIAPLTHDGQGQMLNTNADTMASAVAAALSDQFQVMLVFCFELPGVLRDINNRDSVIDRITPEIYQALKKEGIVADGMIPKLDNSFAALEQGVAQIRITHPQGLAGGADAGTMLRLK